MYNNINKFKIVTEKNQEVILNANLSFTIEIHEDPKKSGVHKILLKNDGSKKYIELFEFDAYTIWITKNKFLYNLYKSENILESVMLLIQNVVFKKNEILDFYRLINGLINSNGLDRAVFTIS